MLTAQSDLQDKLKSFEAGADDHLTKPFEPAELVVRVSPLILRRMEAARLSMLEPATAQVGRLIAIHSLRGGTGCSSLAVNLGVGLINLWTRPCRFARPDDDGRSGGVDAQYDPAAHLVGYRAFQAGGTGFQHAQFHFVFPRIQAGFCCRSHFSFAGGSLSAPSC